MSRDLFEGGFLVSVVTVTLLKHIFERVGIYIIFGMCTTREELVAGLRMGKGCWVVRRRGCFEVGIQGRCVTNGCRFGVWFMWSGCSVWSKGFSVAESREQVQEV